MENIIVDGKSESSKYICKLFYKCYHNCRITNDEQFIVLLSFTSHITMFTYEKRHN